MWSDPIFFFEVAALAHDPIRARLVCHSRRPRGWRAGFAFRGSVTLEAGAAALGPYVGLLGLGRTNQRPYYNLNFDPNDSVLIGAGWRPDEDTALTLFQVRDDRLGTKQRVTHLVLRQKTGPRDAAMPDLGFAQLQYIT